MEKAILKTLIYADYFDYPLKAWEIHKWLIQKTASLKQVEKALGKASLDLRVKSLRGYYFLGNRKGLVKSRLEREKISAKFTQTARFVAILFKLIPWVKLVGISGSLSMMGSKTKDDIDFFIITANSRIWLCRLFLIILTQVTGLRRKRSENKLSASGKICINLILEESNLAQKKRNIYLAHEVLQMRVLWQREGIYSKFLQDNNWAFKYLPNWKSGIKTQNAKRKMQNSHKEKNNLVDWLEELSKKWQLKIMQNPTGAERIESGALYFHPEDKGVKIMELYRNRAASL